MKFSDKNKLDAYHRYMDRTGVRRNTVPDKATAKALAVMKAKPYEGTGMYGRCSNNSTEGTENTDGKHRDDTDSTEGTDDTDNDNTDSTTTTDTTAATTTTEA